VADENAGALVKCPKCGGVIQAPRPGEARPAEARPAEVPGSFGMAPAPALPPHPPLPTPATPPPTAAPATPAGPSAAQAFMADIDKTAKELGLDQLSKILVLSGLGCLALLALTVFFPWISLEGLGGASHTRLGITLASGLMTLIITLEITFFMVFYFFLVKKGDIFNLSVWAAAWWGSHATLWRLIEITQTSRATGWGQYIALIASIGVAVTFGFVAVQRMGQKKT